MFLLFGLRTKDHEVVTRPMACEVCGQHAAQKLVKRTTRFTLFFVPLFPVRAARWYLQCGHCWAFRPARADLAERLTA
jgi:hypothetical protein